MALLVRRIPSALRARYRVNQFTLPHSAPLRSTATMGATEIQHQPKREGDISDSFASLSGERPPLPQEYLEIKRALVRGHEDKLVASWSRLLAELRVENAIVARDGSAVVPTLEFSQLDADLDKFSGELKKRGVGVVRGVIPEPEARAYKGEIEEYVRQNPHTRAFPQNDPQVYELYWSAPQLKARSHPNMLRTHTALMRLWHASDPSSAISLLQPVSYADRLRIRQPGDAHFALGPHVDGGSVERWEPHGYGRGAVYSRVFSGEWDAYDPWDASTRVGAVTDNHNGLGACSAFRAFQGWLSMSNTRAFEGTLMVNPLLRLSTAYLLLRPFFQPKQERAAGKDGDVAATDAFLSESNWEFCGQDGLTSELHGASPGVGQELRDKFHPHLQLDKTMIHMPEVRPGDFVVWHCDTIHAVDSIHKGSSDSSVLYIPVCPLTETNARHLVRSRDAFIKGTPSPDFPGGVGESTHVGRPTGEFLRKVGGEAGMRAAGLERMVALEGDTPGGVAVTNAAASILGF